MLRRGRAAAVSDQAARVRVPAGRRIGGARVLGGRVAAVREWIRAADPLREPAVRAGERWGDAKAASPPAVRGPAGWRGRGPAVGCLGSRQVKSVVLEWIPGFPAVPRRSLDAGRCSYPLRCLRADRCWVPRKSALRPEVKPALRSGVWPGWAARWFPGRGGCRARTRGWDRASRSARHWAPQGFEECRGPSRSDAAPSRAWIHAVLPERPGPGAAMRVKPVLGQSYPTRRRAGPVLRLNCLGQSAYSRVWSAGAARGCRPGECPAQGKPVGR